LAQSDPVDLSLGDIRSQIPAEWLQIAQWSQWRAYKEISIALSNGAIADPLRPSLPPKWGFHMPPTYANGHWSYLCNRWSDPIYV